MEQGADLEAVDRSGYSALSEASMAGHTVVVGQLIRALADPNHRAEDGRTPLHRAAFHGWQPVVRLLLLHGADPSLKDTSGKSPADLSRSLAVNEMLAESNEETTRQAIAEWKLKVAQLPVPSELPEEEPEKTQEPEPPKEEAQVEAAPAPKLRQAEQAQLEKERRESKYREALAELKADLGEDAVDDGSDLWQPQELKSRVRVEGAGEARVNGTYKAVFACSDRVEFEKVGDKSCQIFWSEWHDEWRMQIGDYKMGSTLYRHRYRPNLKVDACHGLPVQEWQKWFGKEPEPSMRILQEEEPDFDPSEETGTQEPTPAVPSAAPKVQKAEFIELHSRLEILAPVDQGAQARVEEHRAAAPQVTLQLASGERLVETADGLFSPDEVAQQPQVEAPSATTQAKAWLENLGAAPPVPATLEAVRAAKAAAQELFQEGKVADARQATTAAIQALKLAAGDTAEVENLLGVLHSNRSLLLMQQIQTQDSEVLAFGEDAAWRLVVADADASLLVNSANFKASFRRARALFELGELEEALVDATRVVDHYARDSATPNPEAVALREKILATLQKERKKWGDRGGPRWNRSSNEALVTELGGSVFDEPLATKKVAVVAPALRARAAAPPVAPKTAADVEKALLSGLKEAAQRTAYVKEHLSATALRSLYRRAPLGPDVLAAIVQTLDEISAEDAALASELLAALAAAPSARTQAAMFDDKERQALERLLKRLGPSAACWASPEDGGA